jgi:hypothetical protein
VKEREYTDNNNWDSNRDKERHRNGQLGNNRPSREEFCNADDEKHECTRSCGRNHNDEEDYESNCITNTNQDASEIIITAPKDKGSKQYRTYLDLVDTFFA